MIDFFVKYFLPPNGKATESDIFRWRLFISFFVLAVSFHIAWVCGWLPNTSGVAFADDVDKKIDEKLAPIEKKLTKVSSGVDTLLKMGYAEKIRAAAKSRCDTTDNHERARINSTIDALQQSYKEVSGDTYDIPSCDDL